MNGIVSANDGTQTKEINYKDNPSEGLRAIPPFFSVCAFSFLDQYISKPSKQNILLFHASISLHSSFLYLLPPPLLNLHTEE